MMVFTIKRYVLVLLIPVFLFNYANASDTFEVLDNGVEINVLEECTASVLNRIVFTGPNKDFTIFNVPTSGEDLRVTIHCLGENGYLTGKSSLITPVIDGVTVLNEDIVLQAVPVLDSLTLTPSKPSLTGLGDTAQLTVTGTYDDGTTADVSSEPDTVYTTSNPNIATVSASGLVTAVSSGTVVLSASKDGVLSTLIMMVSTGTAGDTDGDGMPDDYEISNGLNPDDPFDADLDPDGDGLTNLQEFQTGTDPNVSDTDGDGISDGAEVAGTNGFVTNPLLADTDGDGIQDLLEIQTGTDPTDPNSFDLGQALTSIDVTPQSFTLAYNTVLFKETSQQLTVVGNLSDGNIIDLTSTAKGTNYTSSDLLICNFGATDGEIFAGQDGTCTVTVTNSGFTDTVTVTVETFSPTALSFVSIPGVANNVDVSGDYAFVAAGAEGLQVVDVSDRNFPSIAASLDTPGHAFDVKVLGNTVFLADGAAGLQIIDVSNPLSPTFIGTVDTPGQSIDLSVNGNLVFIADDPTGLQVVDISDISNPVLIGSVDTPGAAQGVSVSGTLAVVADGFNGVHVIDVADPTSPVILGSIDTGNAVDVVFSPDENFVFVSDLQNGLNTVNIADPSTPVIAASVPRETGGLLYDIALGVGGKLSFGADIFFINGVPIMNVENPENPTFRGFIDFSGFRDDNGTGIAVDANYVYLTAQKGGDSRLYIGQYLFFEDTAGIPPTVNITSPVSGNTVIEGSKIPISVSAADDVQVASVDLLVDGQVVSTDTTFPYEFTYVVPVGVSSITFGATAVDLPGNVGTADDVILTVAPDPKTTVTGRVLNTEGVPLSGVTVSTNTGQSSFTLSDGTFSITDVPTVSGFIKVTATQITADGSLFEAKSGPVAPVPGGTVSVGDLVLAFSLFLFDFNGNSFQPDFEQVDYTGTTDDLGGAIGNGTAQVAGGVLQLSSAASGEFPGGEVAKIRSAQALLVGDFDIVIDFNLITFPEVTTGQGDQFITAGIGVTDLQGNEVFLGRYKDPTVDGYEFIQTTGGVPGNPTLVSGMPDTNRQLRLYRVQSRISAYYYDPTFDEWVFISEKAVSTLPMHIEISTSNRRSGQYMEAHFDNLKADLVKNIPMSGDLTGRRDIAVSPSGEFFIGRYGDFNALGDGGIFRVSPEGNLVQFSSVADAFALVFGPTGDLFVANAGANVQTQIFKITPQEQVSIFVAGNQFFSSPRGQVGLGFDGAGFLYTASGDSAFDSDFVYKISPEGNLESIASGPDFSALDVDSAGEVFVGGGLDNILYKIFPNGSIQSLTVPFSNAFRGITVTPNGALYALVGGEVYRVDRDTGSVVKVANASLGLATDLDGNLYSTRNISGTTYLFRILSPALR